MLMDRRYGIAAAVAAALMFLPAKGLIPTAPRMEYRTPGAVGDGKKKRRTFQRYRVEMEHGAPNSRAKRRNAYYRRPAVGNRKAWV